MTSKGKGATKGKGKRVTEGILVELPPGLRARLAAVAREHNRSMNGEAVEAIQRHVEAAERKAAKGGGQ
jgi:hypothetical protein